jgi:lipopolysaccharide/colanic/teichoic acid biosynthesis glycosyltransferase
LLVVAALGIKLSDGGPILHRARRAGYAGAAFTMYKLRTMRLTEGEGSRVTGGGDGRVFAWGRLLRRLKLDELPQLANVARGDMAIVGPRPEDITLVEREYDPWMRRTLEVLPGLTSPGSLDYYAAESELPADSATAERRYLRELLPRKLALDLVYVEHRSTLYDLQLVLRTAAALTGLDLFPAVRRWEEQEAERILREVRA